MASNSSDFFENLFTLLFIIFFIFGSFFKKRKEKKIEKTPQKQYVPMPPRPHKTARREVSKPPPYKPRPLTPENLKGYFEEVLRTLGEAEEEEQKEVRRPTLVKEVPAEKKVIPFEKTVVKPGEKEAELRLRKREKLKKAREAARAKKKEKKKIKKLPEGIGMKLFFDRTEMQRAVIMSEILQKPLALRRRNIYHR